MSSGKMISFPEFQKFSDLFTVDAAAKEFKFFSAFSKQPMYIGTHLGVRNKTRSSLKVRPTQKVIDFLVGNLLFIENDSVFFEAVIRADGTALIVASHSKIIGSRWLALLPVSEIPSAKE